MRPDAGHIYSPPERRMKKCVLQECRETYMYIGTIIKAQIYAFRGEEPIMFSFRKRKRGANIGTLSKYVHSKTKYSFYMLQSCPF